MAILSNFVELEGLQTARRAKKHSGTYFGSLQGEDTAMSPQSFQERLLERHGQAYWAKVLDGWNGERPLEPDRFGGVDAGREHAAAVIPAAVVAAMDKHCKQREELREVFLLGALGAVLLAYSRSDGKLAIAVPARAGPPDDPGDADRLVPIVIGRPDESLPFKSLLGRLHAAYGENKRFERTVPDDPEDGRAAPDYERFVFVYYQKQRRELTNTFVRKQNTELLCTIGPDEAGAWRMEVDYDAGLFSPTLIRSFVGSFAAVLEQAAGDPAAAWTALELRSEEEQAAQARRNATTEPYEDGQTIHGLFERAAARHREKAAVVCGGETMRYGELSERSDAWAAELRRAGIRPGDRVAVMLNRSPSWIAALLAILKAGAVYVPVDPAYPSARVGYMLADSFAAALIVNEGQPEPADFSGKRLVCRGERLGAATLENVIKEFVEASPTVPQASVSADKAEIAGPAPGADGSEHELAPSSGRPAYLLYTSGSTGEPKGVMVEHRGVANLAHYFRTSLGIGADDRVLQFASASFDASIWEIAMALAAGAELHIAEPAIIAEPESFERWAAERGITAATLPPTYADKLRPERLTSLRLLVTAGSESDRELLSRWRERVAYVNAYGPTETTVCATAWHCGRDPWQAGTPVPIGGPLPNTQTHVLNRWLRALPQGVAGELAVSGVGLASGYWNKPELTADKFMRLPDGGARVYRTGDLAKWSPDGNLTFLGRLDRQVKLRGYRIETEEVRHLLVAQPEIREAAVTVKPDPQGEPALVGYYASAAPTDAAELRERLGARLPGYMVPAFLIELDAIPLTPNGKPDIKALPAPGDWLAGAADTPDADPPRDGTEARLAALWRTALGVERIGRQDDFFLLGGHSMKAAKLTAAVYREFGVNLPLERVFRHGTLAELASWIEASGPRGGGSAIPRAPIRDGYPLSPAQRRVFIAEASRPGSTLYVLPFAFRLERGTDFARLEDAFRRLIERHEPLRTSFGWQGNEPIQIVHPAAPFRIERTGRGGLSPEALAERQLAPFELDKPPLLRAVWAEDDAESFTENSTESVTAGEPILLLQLHHIVADGLSLGLLLRDLDAMLSGARLPAPKLQYKDYCEWINARGPSPDSEAHWQERFADYAGTPDLPTDLPRPQVRGSEGATLALQWDAGTAAAVRRLAQSCRSTVHMTMLAAYCVLLSKLTGSEDCIVGSLHGGRDHPDAEDMVGMFVHTLAHRNRADGRLTFREFAERVQKRTLADYAHADYPFELLARRFRTGGASRHPLFDTMFVLQNLEAAPVRIGPTRWTPVVLPENRTRFDLVLQAWDNEDGMLLWVTYATSLFRPATVERIAADYRNLLERLAEDPERPLAELNVHAAFRRIDASGLTLDFQF